MIERLKRLAQTEVRLPFIKQKARPGELSVFCRKLGIMLDAGVPAVKALGLLESQTVKPLLKNAAGQLRSGVLQGRSLSVAMKEAGVFPPFLCGLCQIGEMTAGLPRVMSEMAGFYERQAQMEDELKAALIYPALVMALMLGVLAAAVVVVLPRFANVFAAADMDMPLPTRVLMDISAFTTSNIRWLLIALVLLIAALYAFSGSAPGKRAWSYLRLYTPIFRGVYRQSISLRIAQALQLLLDSGLSLNEAVPVCADVAGNERVRDDLLSLSAALEEGRAFWEALSRIPYLDPMLSGMAQVGEETGKLPVTLGKCREYFEKAHASTIRRLNKLVEPLITIVLGILLGALMLSLILPTFRMMDVV